jgi:hypothetical protein
MTQEHIAPDPEPLDLPAFNLWARRRAIHAAARRMAAGTVFEKIPYPSTVRGLRILADLSVRSVVSIQSALERQMAIVEPFTEKVGQFSSAVGDLHETIRSAVTGVPNPVDQLTLFEIEGEETHGKDF